MNRSSSRVAILIVLLAVLFWSLAKVVADRRPNVIIFLSDDQGWGDLSLHGNPNLSTPNIDSLAVDGAHVDSFYVSSVCSPTRAEFLTGRYHTRMGVTGTSLGAERFDASEQTIAEVFRDNGYATAAFGKWHSGTQWPYHPNARGFDEFYGFCSGHWDNYFSPLLEHNGRIVRGEGFITDDLTNRAIDFITKNRDKPFFVYVPYNIPHSPMQVPNEYWGRFKDKVIEPDPVQENAEREDPDHTRAALAMCENIDSNVGRVLDSLQNLDLADDTIIVYFSDNGPNGHRFNGGLSGIKGSTHEGGVRSPCVIRYPQQIPADSKVDRIAGAIDLLPTLADLAGLELEPKSPLDGISIAPLLRQEDVSWGNRSIYAAWKDRISVRTDRWRMHSDGRLFNVVADPQEDSDIANLNAKAARKLTAEIEEFKNQSVPRESDWPFTVGHPDSTFTHLPARDAVPSGSVQRNNRFPNCSFMTNWTSTDDEIVWDVFVLDAGQFEVEMYYASAGVGSEIELSFDDRQVTTTITDANDVQPTGIENDRVERREGFTKDWKSMKLGTIKLTRGRGDLKLRATKVIGDQVAEMRLLVLKRID